MKERPIIYIAEMVRAILEGRKTHTRRVMKVQPQRCHSIARDAASPSGYSLIADAYDDEYLICPQGKPGDEIWVKENYRSWSGFNNLKPSEIPKNFFNIHYESDFTPDKESALGKLRPSIFMCRWMSRIQLEMTDLRIERLNEISEDDARAEGARVETDNNPIAEISGITSRYFGFKRLWESINGPGSFDDRYVWVEEF